MRLGWHIHLIGPFYLSGTLSKARRNQGYVRKWEILDCGHAHRSAEAYLRCTGKS